VEPFCQRTLRDDFHPERRSVVTGIGDCGQETVDAYSVEHRGLPYERNRQSFTDRDQEDHGGMTLDKTVERETWGRVDQKPAPPRSQSPFARKALARIGDGEVWRHRNLRISVGHRYPPDWCGREVYGGERFGRDRNPRGRWHKGLGAGARGED
jgi:hypothetical protein